MKLAKFTSVFIILMLLIYSCGSNQHHENTHQEHSKNDTIVVHEVTHENVHSKEHVEHSEDHDAEHHSDMSPLLFIIIALLIGAATRHFLRKSPIPFTVLLLIFGLITGILVRGGFFAEWAETFSRSVKWAGHIDPHLILYIFLPTLIFEAAFAMDVHTFKKSVANASLLAIPGIIVALLLTGGFMMLLKFSGIGLPDWSWPVALLFGVVISATDPVAVVALLKELGASKKLGTLIEGESLLNDGTAIVIFLVILGGIKGAAPDMEELQAFVFGLNPVLKFAYISFGGILLGLVIGSITIRWVRNVFNDAMVEISAIVVAAYITFFIAEHFIYVSGVLGLVTLGLVTASVGRTRISPEVEHFLHEFWELLAFIANTLIFFIVGVVIAEQAVFTGKDFLILFLIYIAIHIVRAIVITILYPLMRKSGYGIDRKNAYVLWYGALRGAIGLALALIIAGLEPKYMSETIQNQFLFYTAGIVFLTLVVNATTIKLLVQKLGLTKLSPAKQLMVHNSQSYLHKATVNAIDKLRTDRFMSNANWEKVNDYLPPKPSTSDDELEKVETIAEFRRRILEQEKSSYWHQFKEGLLGPNAVRKLSDAINNILDAGGMIPLSERQDLEASWKTPKILARLHKISLLGKMTKRIFFERLSVSFDAARGFVDAQDDALKLVESMYRGLEENDEEGVKNLETIEEEINTNRIHGLTFLRNLRKSYPEIYSAISTRQAIRSLLNYEMRTVERLQKKGRIDSSEKEKLTEDIETKMKQLLHSPPSVELPENIKLLKTIEWLNGVDQNTINKISSFASERILAVGESLMKENKIDNSIYIIVRGSVKVSIKDEVRAVLGPGNIIGEMAVMTSQSSSASVSAESPVTTLRVKYLKFQRLVNESKELESNIWAIICQRAAENLLSETSPYDRLTPKKIKRMVSKGEVIRKAAGEKIQADESLKIFITGEIKDEDTTFTSYAILENKEYEVMEDSLVYLL